MDERYGTRLGPHVTKLFRISKDKCEFPLRYKDEMDLCIVGLDGIQLLSRGD